MGFASRKLGNYRQALVHYQTALELNPHHRGALEYLGEAYLEMGCAAQARASRAPGSRMPAPHERCGQA
jgi:tetratricopeptide (TPR) repeat protein